MNNNFNNWQATKEKVKQQYPNLTEDDLHYEAGKEEDLLERMEKKIGKNRHDIREWLSLMG